MADEWRRVRAADVAIRTAAGPFGSAISCKFFCDAGVPVIRGSNLSQEIGVRLNDEGLVFLQPEKAADFSRSVAMRGDLVFTCWGTIDQVGFVDGRASYESYVVSNKQMLLSPDSSKADGLFLYYLFSSPKSREEILSQGIGSSVPGFNLGQLRAFEILLPPLCEQKRIAHILGTLDDKIDLNRKVNATLEAMSRAIFKSWFVDFDPVRAKAAGRQPEGMDAETAALFPDSFEGSEIGEVPKGWCLTRVADVTHRVTKGDTPLKSAVAVANQATRMVSMIRVNAISEDGQLIHGNLVEIPEAIHLGKSRRSILKPGYILYTNAGTIGRVAYVQKDWLPANTNQAVAIIQPNEDLIIPAVLYMALRQPEFQYELHKDIVEAVQANLALGKIAESRLVLPPLPALKYMFSAVQSHLLRVWENQGQSRTLATLRDTLLPKLLSGEVRVPEAEKAVDEAVG